MDQLSELRASVEEIYSINKYGLFNTANTLQNVKKKDLIELLYRMSIEQGVTEACLNYGTFLAENPRRRREAIVLYKTALEKGYMRAAIGLGRVYLDLNEVDSAIHWINMARDDEEAFTLLAEAYRLKNDEASAVAELLRGMRKSAKAALELTISTDGLDTESSIRLLEEHLQRGELDVLLPLAACYSKVSRNAEAISLLRQAVEIGEPNALHDLGKTLIDSGKYDEGVAYLREASDKGDKLSMVVLQKLGAV